MTPLQINSNGQLVIFKSRRVFLEVIGYSHTYTSTVHYKAKYGEETPQKLWNRVENAREKLERLMQQYSPTIDPETGMKSYRHGRVIVCPVGYVPPPLREHVAIETVNGEQVPVALNDLLEIRIREEIDILVQQCHKNEGKEAADQLRASITEISIGVKSVSGDADHWLVEYLDHCLFNK